MRRAVQMRAKCHAFFSHFAELAKAENLKTAGVGENRPRPRHESVQSPQPSNLVHSGPQIKVIGVAEQNLNAEFFEHILGHAFDRGLRPHGHEDWRLHLAVSRHQPTSSCGPAGFVDFKTKRHPARF